MKRYWRWKNMVKNTRHIFILNEIPTVVLKTRLSVRKRGGTAPPDTRAFGHEDLFVRGG